FDMDGVLLDSEPFIIKAATQMFAERGLHVQPEDFHPFTGAGEKRFLGGVAKKYDFDFDVERDKTRTYDIYLDIIKGNLQPLAGVSKFIKLCRDMGKKIAVASSADMRKVRGNLEQIQIQPKTFDVIVVGDDVEHKKPSPDIFILAAEKIGLSPRDCLVIEDAPSGIQAGKAAESKCLAITSSFDREQLKDADWFAPDLSAVPDEAINWR
ncbi:MAG: HAD-IA family hydrolase, partial [Planctomycetes bacterium]|nr:HAD-IA family hydrolase [Planctomycetota bacterium]